MTPCPHCQKATIGYFAKHASWSGGPVRCRDCGGLSYMPTVSSGPSIYGNLLFIGWPFVAIPIAIVTNSVVFAAVVMAVAFAAFLVGHELVLRRTKLVPVTAAEVAASRRSALVFGGVLLLVAVVLLGIRTYNAI